MKLLTFLLAAAVTASAAEAPPKKPAPKPPAKAAAKQKKPAAPMKPQKSIGDLALAEARQADQNKDGHFTGTEVMKLRSMLATNPKSWLYIYDDNGNRMLDDAEISKIKIGPATPPKPPAPAPAKPKAKTPPKKK